MSRPGAADLDQEVLEAAADVFRVSAGAVSSASGPRDIPRWDSFGHLEFVLELEVRFSIKLSTAEILQVKRLADAQRLVRAKLAQ